MTEELIEYDPADALENQEAIEYFIADALETGNSEHIAYALGVATRAKERITNQTIIEKQYLSESFSENSNPTLKAVMTILNALNIKITNLPSACR